MKIVTRYTILNDLGLLLTHKRGHVYWNLGNHNTRVFRSLNEVAEAIADDEYLSHENDIGHLEVITLDVVIDDKGSIQCIAEYGSIVRSDD